MEYLPNNIYNFNEISHNKTNPFLNNRKHAFLEPNLNYN